MTRKFRTKIAAHATKYWLAAVLLLLAGVFYWVDVPSVTNAIKSHYAVADVTWSFIACGVTVAAILAVARRYGRAHDLTKRLRRKLEKI